MAEKIINKMLEEGAKKSRTPKFYYSKIENGVLIKFDNRDLTKTGHFVVPKGVTRIGTFAFAHSAIKSVGLPVSLKRIDDYAFYWCKSLEKVRISSGVQSIGTAAFCVCENLRDINCPENLIFVGKDAFKWCPVYAKMTKGVRENQVRYARRKGVTLD